MGIWGSRGDQEFEGNPGGEIGRKGATQLGLQAHFRGEWSHPADLGRRTNRRQIHVLEPCHPGLVGNEIEESDAPRLEGFPPAGLGHVFELEEIQPVARGCRSDHRSWRRATGGARRGGNRAGAEADEAGILRHDGSRTQQAGEYPAEKADHGERLASCVPDTRLGAAAKTVFLGWVS